MGNCNCGGRRGRQASAAIAAGNGVAAVWRLTHPNGSTVDYWQLDGSDGARAAHAALLAKETRDAELAGRTARPVLLTHVDSRTGLALV